VGYLAPLLAANHLRGGAHLGLWPFPDLMFVHVREALRRGWAQVVVPGTVPAGRHPLRGA
jgi:hypothetical protein